MALWVNEDDAPALMLMSPGQPGGLTMSLAPDQRFQIVLRATRFKGEISLGFLDDGNSVILFMDKVG